MIYYNICFKTPLIADYHYNKNKNDIIIFCFKTPLIADYYYNDYYSLKPEQTDSNNKVRFS